MKTTIKLSPTRALTVEPCRLSDMVCLTVIEVITNSNDQKMTAVHDAIFLTPDQVGALIVGLEQAAPETSAVSMLRNFEAECM